MYGWMNRDREIEIEIGKWVVRQVIDGYIHTDRHHIRKS